MKWICEAKGLLILGMENTDLYDASKMRSSKGKTKNRRGKANGSTHNHNTRRDQKENRSEENLRTNDPQKCNQSQGN
jgi:hypothetical protein